MCSHCCAKASATASIWSARSGTPTGWSPARARCIRCSGVCAARGSYRALAGVSVGTAPPLLPHHADGDAALRAFASQWERFRDSVDTLIRPGGNRMSPGALHPLAEDYLRAVAAGRTSAAAGATETSCRPRSRDTWPRLSRPAHPTTRHSKCSSASVHPARSSKPSSLPAGPGRSAQLARGAAVILLPLGGFASAWGGWSGWSCCGARGCGRLATS